MKYRLAIFDMDGTILDTLEDLENSLNDALESNGFRARSRKEVRSIVGNGAYKLVEQGLPSGCTRSEVKCVLNSFSNHYIEHCMDKTKPYDGIVDAIVALKKMGMKVAVVSNKADDAVKMLCEQYFSGLFDAAIGMRENMRRKPAPDSVGLVLDTLGISCEDAVYIGDTEVDIETAENANTDCIAVCWGFRDKMQLLDDGADIVISTPSELLEALS